MEKREYKVNKSVVQNNEEKAAQNASKKLGVETSQLLSVHTEKQFVFIVNSDDEGSLPSLKDKFTVEKTNDYSLADAKRSAMDHFKTFEGNIKIVEQDETHIVFSKVRQ